MPGFGELDRLTPKAQIPEELMERARGLAAWLDDAPPSLHEKFARKIATALQAERKRAYLDCAEIAVNRMNYYDAVDYWSAEQVAAAIRRKAEAQEG